MYMLLTNKPKKDIDISYLSNSSVWRYLKF